MQNMFFVQLMIEYAFNNAFSLLLFVLFYYLMRHILGTYIERQRLPPGPIGLPLVGYLPFLGKHPHKDIAKLSDKYGNVFT